MLRIFHITESKYIYSFYCLGLTDSYHLMQPAHPTIDFLVREGFRNLCRWSIDKEMAIRYSPEKPFVQNRFHPDEFEIREFSDA